MRDPDHGGTPASAGATQPGEWRPAMARCAPAWPAGRPWARHRERRRNRGSTPLLLRARLADPALIPRDRPSPEDDLDRAARSGGRTIEAAVLVPLVLHDDPTILLTLRSARLNSHAGQVAFPGGRMEAGETPEQAALREAQEEVGLDPAMPDILGPPADR